MTPADPETMRLEELHARLTDCLRLGRLGEKDRGIALGFVRVCNLGGTPSRKQSYCARRIIAEQQDLSTPPLIEAEPGKPSM